MNGTRLMTVSRVIIICHMHFHGKCIHAHEVHYDYALCFVDKWAVHFVETCTRPLREAVSYGDTIKRVESWA